MSNAFTFASASEFARKASLDCVLPAIGVALYHKECGFNSNAQLGLAAFAIHTALSCLPDVECKVSNVDMISYMSNAIEQVHKLNRDKKDFYITHTPEEMLAFTVAMRWMSIEKETMLMSITDKWVQLTTGSRALLPMNERITDENRRVPFVKRNKVPGSKLLRNVEQFLSDTAYHVESAMGLAVNEYLEAWKVKNANKGRNARLPARLDAEMYVHKGSELVHSASELFSEYTADARGRLYHAACFGPNPQSGDMARAYYSHNVENWVEKGTEAYEIFMTELAVTCPQD